MRTAVLGVVLVVALALETKLPELIKTEVRENIVINATMGENFSIPLPNFDSPYNNDTFQVYEVSPEDVLRVEKGEKPGDGRLLPWYDLPFECHYQEAEARVHETFNTYKDEYNKYGSHGLENQYANFPRKLILYALNVGSGQLTLYQYSVIHLHKPTTIRLPQDRRYREQNSTRKSQPTIAASSDEEKLYIFTSEGVWEVPSETGLAQIEQVEGISGFNSREVGGVDKVLHGQNGLLVALKRILRRVYLIPEAVEGQQLQFSEISEFRGQKIFPQDVILRGNTLLVLDSYKGVLVYDLVSGRAEEREIIPHEPAGGNTKFVIHDHTMFIGFNDHEGSKVVEVAFDEARGDYTLVRYFKTRGFITDFNVFEMTVAFDGMDPMAAYSVLYGPYLFLVENNDRVEIYPFDLDPRTIDSVYNAVRLKYSGVRHMFAGRRDHKMVAAKEQFSYHKLHINRPSVKCRSIRSQARANSYQVVLKAKESTCEDRTDQVPKKTAFNQYCESETHFYIRIADPESSQWRRLVLYLGVLAVVVTFLGGLVCLMQWRSSKMAILGRLKEEITRFRARHKRVQPYAEEEFNDRDIEVDMPRVEVSADDER